MVTLSLTPKTRLLFTARVWKMGKSICFPLQKLLREAIGVKRDDLLIMRVHGPYVTFRIAQPGAVIPVDTFEPEDLPPSWIGRDDNVHAEEETCPRRD